MKEYYKIIAAMLVWSTWGMMIRWIDLPPSFHDGMKCRNLLNVGAEEIENAQFPFF